MKSLWYQLPVEQVLADLGTTRGLGLTTSIAHERLGRQGPNELVAKAGRTRLSILWEQLSGILTVLLFVAALISTALGDWLEAIIILIIVILNAILGFVQEYRAEQSMAALKRMSVPHVRVRRNGNLVEITPRELVPGDIVVLETGNIVPADGRVIEAVNPAEEAALTGESEPVEKDAHAVYETERSLGDRRNMVYSGTIINYGRGEFVVTETGMQTELGHIAGMIQAVEDDQTPLQQRLDRLGKVLAYAALGLVALIFILGLLRGHNDIEELLLTSVSLAVAAVPEALTATVTIALSLGAQRMLKRQALIRRLPAVETLGSVSVICSDKTGTLTQNRMTVTVVDIADHKFELVQKPGEVSLDLAPAGGRSAPLPGALPTLDLLLVAGALCNDAALVPGEGGRFHAVGDPTEGALVLAAAQLSLLKPDLDNLFPRVAEAPFDSIRKRMTTLHRVPEAEAEIPASLLPAWERRHGRNEMPAYIAFVKGAVDGLLALSASVWVDEGALPLDETWRARVMQSHDQMAAQGMRVLAVALRAWDREPDETTEKALERDLVLLGLFGMMDPPRPEVRPAVLTCRIAGIRPVMITGDHPLTARHIAHQVGITDNDLFLTGQELDRLSPEELAEAANRVSVFARVSPEHKLKLIAAYQSQDQTVSMTGDGVNDAPALKKADIGVAMGITGTDVAKGAADMVLLDDNFATIVAAVEEGRVIFDNIRRFIKYLLTCNASEIGVMLLGPFLGMPLPLLPLQILWMNLVTDGLPALALGVEPAEKDVMKRPPYSSVDSVFGRGMVQFILVVGLIMSALAIGAAWALWSQGDLHWQTMLFTTLVFTQVAVAVAVRSEQQPVIRAGLFGNRSMVIAVVLTVALQLAVVYLPFAQVIFKTTAMPLQDLALAIGLALAVFVIVEVWKALAAFVARRAANSSR